ncbi:MAG TPA: acyl-CoA dehydrogenase family protein [Acidisphaera sp.]|nr:acyl-CoA dehydrogenase family protein [Acidisphaera sp.]
MSDDDDNVRLVRDSARAVVPAGGDCKRIRALRFTQPGFDRDVWRQIEEMGWPLLRVPEVDGGSGLGMGEFCALAEELGAGLVPEPLIPVAMAMRIAPEFAGRIVIPAWQERANCLSLHETARLCDRRISGTKAFVPMAAGADAFLVTTADGNAVVRRDAHGVRLEIEITQDGGNFGTLHLDDAPAEPVGGDAEAALDEAVLATAAYLLGVMDRAFAITLDYMRTRQQFGRPIGSFQALHHRAVDVQVQIALTRASVEAAAATLDADPTSAQRQAVVSRAKARASDAALFVTREAVQLHGGIAYTDEYDIGLFVRKAMVLCNLFGSSSVHRARYAAVQPESDDE